MLSEDIATEMRGRSVEVEIFPLSFAEYLSFNGIFAKPPALPDAPHTRGKLKKALADYLAVGGFPDVQRVDTSTRIKMLQSYADAVIYRDIIERHTVASVQSLKYVLQYLLHNFARKTSVSSRSSTCFNIWCTISGGRRRCAPSRAFSSSFLCRVTASRWAII